MSAVTRAPVLWTLAQPNRCACDDTYRPQLNGKGKLVKSREPAWRMPEQTAGNHCLQEQARAASKRYPPLTYVHHNDSRKATAGYPDVHIWADDGRGSVYIELKRMGKDPSPVQVARMASLGAAGHLVYLCRPCCLFTGTIDRIMASRAGLDPRGEYVLAPAVAPNVLPTAPELAATPRPPRPRRPAPELPGAEPPAAVPGGVGYVVPMTAAVDDRPAMAELEGWLRAAGFPPMGVPFPIRVVAGGDQVVVQVRASDGAKVWRGGRTFTPFPTHLLRRLRADVIAGPPQFLLSLLEHAVPGAELPEQDWEQQPGPAASDERVCVVCPETDQVNYLPPGWAARVGRET